MNYRKIVESCSLILNNPDYMYSYCDNPGELLNQVGVTEIEDQQGINDLLIPIAEFKQRQIKVFMQKTDYEKKIQCLYELTNNPQAAAMFEASPAEYFNRAGKFTPEEQQQVLQLLTPIKGFQQIMINHMEERNNYLRKIECLKKLLHNDEDHKLLKTNAQLFYSNNGITDLEDQQLITNMLLPAERLSKIAIKNITDQADEINTVNSSYRLGLSQANHQTIKGFNATMIMYQVSFYLGVALIITALVFAFLVRSSLFTIVFGSIGTLDLLTFFIAKPPLSLQESRSEQAKLNAAFYSWFLDLYNWNSFYVQYSQKGELITLETMKKVSDAQIANTEKLMQIISRHINIDPKT